MFTIRYIVEAKTRPLKWNILKIEEIKTHRIELEDFEVVTQFDNMTKWMIEEFEELLRLRDKHLKLTEHIKVLTYGRDRNGELIAITLLKDLSKTPPNLVIYTYNVKDELTSLRELKTK